MLIRVCLLAIVLAALPATAGALSVVERSFDELVQQADLVVAGRVTDSRSYWRGEDNQRRIFSAITLAELEVIKGEVAGDTYTLHLAGGVVGRVAQYHPGAPNLQKGRHYLLFVRGNGQTLFPLVGVGQGMFHVEPFLTPDSKTRITDQQGRPVVGITDGEIVTSASQRGLTPALSLPDLRRAIEARLGTAEETAP